MTLRWACWVVFLIICATWATGYRHWLLVLFAAVLALAFFYTFMGVLDGDENHPDGDMRSDRLERDGYRSTSERHSS